jgi:signal transduction histidine kinase
MLTGAGYQVRPARFPRLAIDAARAQPPDLILLDVRMPEMDGFEVCRRLKRDDRTRNVPIIFVSALQDVQDRVRGFELGGVDFISKPFQEPEILARVRNHVALHKMTAHLEDLVAQRTAELTAKNQVLNAEIEERTRAEAALREYRDRLRALASDLTITEERERRRLSEELHDGPIQVLAFARMLLNSARKKSDASERDRALDEVSESLRQAALASIRIVSDLSSPTLKELGLMPAISDWAKKQIHQQFGIETTVISHLEETDARALDDLSGALLFRNVRELLANVVEHSQAGNAHVVLERAGDNLELTVRDDGRGCNPGTSLGGRSDEQGFGLFSIRERMADLGGALEIESRPGQGFAATLVMPLGLDRSTASV